MKTNDETTNQCWSNLPSGEKHFIRALIGMIRSAKHSQVTEVARAARKWETGLTFFFKVRLRNQRPRWSAVSVGEKNRANNRPISYQSIARSQQGVSPGQG